MDVHQVVDDAGLDVAFMFVNLDLAAGVVDLHPAEVWLLRLADSFVLPGVVFDPVLEVCQDLVLLKVLVVRAVDLYGHDVGVDYALVVADRLHEEQLEAFLFHDLQKTTSKES